MQVLTAQERLQVILSLKTIASDTQNRAVEVRSQGGMIGQVHADDLADALGNVAGDQFALAEKVGRIFAEHGKAKMVLQNVFNSGFLPVGGEPYEEVKALIIRGL